MLDLQIAGSFPRYLDPERDVQSPIREAFLALGLDGPSIELGECSEGDQISLVVAAPMPHDLTVFYDLIERLRSVEMVHLELPDFDAGGVEAFRAKHRQPQIQWPAMSLDGLSVSKQPPAA
jgi:hypothetical protein